MRRLLRGLLNGGLVGGIGGCCRGTQVAHNLVDLRQALLRRRRGLLGQRGELGLDLQLAAEVICVLSSLRLRGLHLPALSLQLVVERGGLAGGVGCLGFQRRVLGRQLVDASLQVDLRRGQRSPGVVQSLCLGFQLQNERRAGAGSGDSTHGTRSQ